MRTLWLLAVMLLGCSGESAPPPPAEKAIAPDEPADAPKVYKPAVPDRFGASWRLSGSRFEDLTGNYAIEAPPGWTLRVDAAPAWPGSVGIVADGTGIEGSIVRRPSPSQNGPREELEALGVVALEEAKIRINGRKRPALIYVNNHDGREYQLARWCEGKLCTAVEFAYPRTAVDARNKIRRAAFELDDLSPQERQSLRDALVSRGKARSERIEGLEFADLRLTDRRNGISFALPGDGPWEVHLGDAARARANQRFVLARFANVETGLVLKYSANPVAGLTTNASYHRTLLDGLTQQFGASVRTTKPRAVELGSLPALQSEFDMNILRVMLVTATIDNRVVQFTITQDMLEFDDQREVMDRFIASVEGDGVPAAQRG